MLSFPLCEKVLCRIACPEMPRFLGRLTVFSSFALVTLFLLVESLSDFFYKMMHFLVVTGHFRSVISNS